MLLGLGLFVVWFTGLIIVGDKGYPSQYFWISGTIITVAFAVSPFWRLRSSKWFWPTAILIELANLTLLWLKRGLVANPELPSKGVVKGLMLLDLAGSWAVMAGVCWLFCKQFPWELSDE